ncbi:unnamed protein product [Chondrus crispus]|uniref:Mitotic spindle assembly checkpoint protein MAD1 n=1 Tax=Chondrus crispus TaxID=2769 RepID=R7QTF9_CHOCR|nr:unnamed protein product [Chondrus crispus]CDF40660.1 unnamed protein product [Chondrus crispus]|eukprot:XP_005710954.1 unnamed protein product [Chondrus crispus]
MSTPNRSEAVLEAREALRKLSGDLAVYRDPEVQRHLLNPALGSKRHLDSSSPAELHALIINLRTELNQAAEERQRTKEDILNARKRAARAEGQIDELQQQLTQKEVEHDEIVEQASTRIDALVKEHRSALLAARDKAFLLQETLEKDHLGHKSIIAEKDRLRIQCKEAESKLDGMRREIEATEERHAIEMKATVGDMERAWRKVDALQNEVERLRKSHGHTSGFSKEVATSRTLAKKLQIENASLKSELASQSKELIAKRSELARAKAAADDTKERIQNTQSERAELLALREEKRSLRDLRRKSANFEDHLSALAREKEELTGMIRDLSPTCDVQEGLEILKASKFDGLAKGKMTIAERNVLSQKNRELENTAKQSQNDLARQAKQIAQLKKSLEDAAAKLTQMRLARDNSLSSGKRHERMRGIIEYEKSFFKQALEKIETDFDKPQSTDQYAERLRKRAEMYEKSCEKYKSELKELETALNEHRRNAEGTAKGLIKASSEWPGDGKVVTDAEGRGPEITKALQKMKSTIDAQEKVIKKSEMFEKRAKELEAEVQRLRKVQTETEFDYDPAVAKVVHMKSNPLEQAVKRAQEEEQIKAGKKRMRLDVGDLSPGRDGALDSRILGLQKEIRELESKNEDLAKKSKLGIRLGEVAKKKIEEVRAAVYNLFGWSMNVYGANYRISSIYAEGPRDLLEFGMNETGTMTLMETEYTSRLAEEIEQYVQKMNSVPALLASITIENFEKTTSFA